MWLYSTLQTSGGNPITVNQRAALFVHQCNCYMQIGLKAAIEAEFGRLMAKGGLSANEAALTAVHNVSVQQVGG